MPVRRLVADRRVWAVSFFLAITLFVFWPFISGTAFLWNDFAEYSYPMQAFAARSMAAGVTPWWNPYLLNGMPFIADPQVGFFYPINQLMYLLAHGTLTTTLMQAFLVLHYFVAMLGMWMLARGIGIAAWGAVVAGIAFALSGPMLAHMIHPNMVEQLAWWPLALHLLLSAMRRCSLASAIASGLVFGGSFLAGHPQSAVHELAFAAVVIIWFAVVHRGGAQLGRRALLGVVSCTIAIGVFAIQWFPSLELVRQSERAELSYQQSLQDALAPGQLLTLVTPRFFGVNAPTPVPGSVPFWDHDGAPGGAPGARSYWETMIYVGVPVLILALTGLRSGRLGGFGWLLAGLAFLGLIYALGDRTPLHAILSSIPVLGTFRAPARLGIYLMMAAPLLAGAGIDALLTRTPRATGGSIVVAGVVAIIAVLVLTGAANGLLRVPDAVAAAARSSAIVPLLLAIATGVVAWLASRGSVTAGYVGPLCLALVLLDLGWLGPAKNRGNIDPLRDVYQRVESRYASLIVHPPFAIFRSKIRDYQADNALMPRNQGSFSGMMLYDGYNPLRLARRTPLAATPAQQLDLLDVRYDHADGGQPGSLVERGTRLPHARVVFAAQVSSDDSVAMLDAEPLTSISTGSGTATITRYDAGALEVDVTASAPGLLVLSEVWYPAWRADVDGTPARVLRAYGALRAVAVPEGQHHVRMIYASASARSGTAVTGVTLLVAAGGLVFGRRRRDGQTLEKDMVA